MSDSASSFSILARKYRKKLRQIESLERLNRPLCEEECVKVNSKPLIRERLKDVLEQLEEEAATTNDNITPAKESQAYSDNQIPSQPFSSGAEPLSFREGENVAQASNVTNTQVVSNSRTGGGDVKASEPKSASKTAGSSVPSGKSDEKTQPKAESNKQSKGVKSSKSGAHLSKQRCKVICLDGHNDIVMSLVVVDGRAVTASRDTTLKSWDLTSGEELHTFGAHTESVTCVLALPASCGQLVDSDFSSDDHLIISSSFDCTFKMWSLNTGRLVKSVYTFNPLTRISFLQSSRQLVTGSDGGKLELWDIATGDNSFSCLAHEASITGIAVSDTTVYSSSTQGVIKVHQRKEDGSLACLFVSEDVKTMTSQPLTMRHVCCLTLTPQGLLYGDDAMNLKLLDWKKGQVKKFVNHTSNFTSADAVACHGAYVVSSSYDLDEGLGYINVRQSETLAYLATIDDQDTEKILCLDFCFGPFGDLIIVTGGMDLKMWHIVPTGGPPSSSTDDDNIGLEFRQALSVSATDSDSESEEEDEETDEEGDDVDGRERLQPAQNSTQQGGVWSWCSVL